MAGNIAAPLKGQEYQWLYGWLRCLDLLGPKREVDVVHVENPVAGFFDDVTVTPVANCGRPVEFLQVKYHARQDGCYSFEGHANTDNPKKGLLHKAWVTWRRLRDEHAVVRLVLVSPWQWSTDDPVLPADGRWPDDFVTGDVPKAAVEVRLLWSSTLDGPDEDEFRAFLESMRFRLGHDDIGALEDRCREVMRAHGLRTDKVALTMARTAIRDRVMERDAEITVDVMESILEELELREEEPEPAVTLQIHTIRRQEWATGAENMGSVYELDWCDVFEGPEHKRGHHLIDDEDWNGRLLPELQAKAIEIERNETARLLRLRGFARLTAHVAAGYVFPRTARWTIETLQGTTTGGRMNRPLTGRHP